jgi:tripartite-type tricarboxylate transporter receptor subunit TctC
MGVPAFAQTYPARPIRLIVGYSPGGGNDLIARIVAAKLQEKLGQPVIVDNRPGAQSIVAAEAVAKAPSDGYTLLVAPSGPMTINPAVYAKLSYSPQRDFSPISLLAAFPLLLAGGAERRPKRRASWSNTAAPTPSSPTMPRAPRPSSSHRSCSTSAPARSSSTSPIAAAAMRCRPSPPARC